MIMKFADDTKGLQEIRDDNDRRKLQTALDRLVEWSKKWCMEFNVKKCKIMHIGCHNPGYSYYMNGQELQVVEEERDIGVIVQRSLKPGKQCERAASMGNTVLNQLVRNFHYRDRKIFKQLYITYVRPHLEFATQAWSPWTTQDCETLEKVQRKAVRMISGLDSTASYEQKCKEIGLDTLASRRRKQDLLQTFRILRGIDSVAPDKIFQRQVDRQHRVTRTADPSNLTIPHARTDLRINSFQIRAAKAWNSLDKKVKESNSLAAFKNALNNTGERLEIEGGEAR